MSIAELDRADAAEIEAGLRASLDRLRAAWRAEPNPSLAVRKERLKALRAALLARRDEIAEAIRADFGNRSKHETHVAEVLVTNEAIKYMLGHLAGWMASESRHVSPLFWMARAHVQYQPLGVVGVISPWNYPLQLAAVPVATAIAAGNRVMVKPSELTPATSALLAELLPAALGDEVISVHPGGVEVGQAFARLPLDHLLYTGSTHVGKLVMRAASENLTPVTLELGGKSPALCHRDADIQHFAARIASGKLLNAGQTCVAPDYVLVPRGLEDTFVQAFRNQVAALYPTLVTNPDYTSIVNERHLARLRSYLDDARSKGARIEEVNPAGESFDDGGTKLAPHLLLDVTDEMRVMQDEIFGPLLPVVPYDHLEQAITYINDRPRPLAFYYFDNQAKRIDHVLEHTISGGAVVNDTLIHVGIDDLPFGGVGPSGMGAYHGKEGFETFSHKRAVVRQSRLNSVALISPPYGRKVEKILDLLLR